MAPGQAIAFELNSIESLKAAHLSMKSTGGTAKIKIFSASSNIEDVSRMEIKTATDRYYDLTELVGDTVIIVNVGSSADGILSITNVKLTTDPYASQTVSFEEAVTISQRSANRALNALTARTADQGQAPGGNVPETGDVQADLMISLALVMCLSMVAVLLLVHMDKRLVKRTRTR